MAGKKVKCKHCAKVFQIPAAGAEENDAPQTGIPAPFKAVQKSAAVAAASPAAEEGSKSTPSGKLGNASAGYAARMARSENIVEVELAESAAPIVMLRPTIPHDFPGAPLLDQWGPLLMILLGLGWLSQMALQSNHTSQGWVGTVRLGAYLFFCLGVAFPLAYLAIRISSQKCRLMLPPMSAVRVLGIISLSFALALVFWLSAETVSMLVVGTIMGLGLLGVSSWFFFRLQSQEMPSVIGSAAAAFVGSIIISYLAMMGISFLFASSARSSGSNQLAASPMGPTFNWDVPVGENHKARPKIVAVIPPIADTVPSTIPSKTDSVESPHDTIPDANPPAVPHVDPTPPVTPPKDSTPPPATTQATAKPPVKLPVQPSVVVTPEPALSPLVAKITTIADLGDFNHVIFPTGSGNLIAALKKGETEETVAFFSGNPLTMKAETKFDIEKEIAQNYCISPNGETLARLTTFPKLGVLLWNTTTNKEFKVLPLNAERGKPELLGFGVNDNVIILWNTGRFMDIEVINSKANPPQAIVQLRLKMFDRSPCNPTISPDGRQMAVATFIDKKGGLDLWDLTSNRKAELRTCFVPLGTWITPMSITYATVGGHLSAYFEVDAKGVFYSFRTGDGGLMHEFPYRTLPYPVGTSEKFTGRTLDYLDASTWLLLGRPIIDAESGKVLGELQIDNVRAQHVVDKETVLVHVQSAEGKNQLLEVKLKPDVIAAKRAEARGLKNPKPAHGE
jgi:hypothetical protein